MCGLCLSRRAFLATATTLPFGVAAASDTLIEPSLRLASPAGLTVALTLDACSGAFDQRIAAALIEASIPATIFATGIWLRANPAGVAVMRAHPDLFNIQNHGARHIPPVLGQRRVYGIRCAGDLDTILGEVTDGATAITAAIDVAPKWYRAATGLYSPTALPAIKRLGFAIAGYSLNADSGASLPAKTVAARIANAGPSAVIVAHVNQPARPSGQGVADGLRALKGRDARFVRLDRLGPADFAPWSYDLQG